MRDKRKAVEIFIMPKSSANNNEICDLDEDKKMTAKLFPFLGPPAVYD